MQGLLAALLLFTMAFQPSYALKMVGKFPKGCRQVGHAYNDKELILTPSNEDEERQTLYLIHNKTHRQLVLLAHEKNYELLNMNWQMIFDRNAWSSFAINKNRLPFVCQQKLRGNKVEQVDCHENIDVCEYNRAKFGDHILGTYWVVVNKPLATVVSKSIKKGILLRW